MCISSNSPVLHQISPRLTPPSPPLTQTKRAGPGLVTWCPVSVCYTRPVTLTPPLHKSVSALHIAHNHFPTLLLIESELSDQSCIRVGPCSELSIYMPCLMVPGAGSVRGQCKLWQHFPSPVTSTFTPGSSLLDLSQCSVYLTHNSHIHGHMTGVIWRTLDNSTHSQLGIKIIVTHSHNAEKTGLI